VFEWRAKIKGWIEMSGGFWKNATNKGGVSAYYAGIGNLSLIY